MHLTGRRGRRAIRRGIVAVLTEVLLLGGTALIMTLPSAAAVPVIDAPGFVDSTVLGGFNQPTAAAFAPDGRVFVVEKAGLVKVFDSLSDLTPTVFADLRTQVFDYWDKGLLGVTVDPHFPDRPYVYVAYAYDAPPGQQAPYWNDQCPMPPGATADGCVTQARVSRLTMGATGTSVAEKVLVTGWCAQFPSHTIGTLQFGPDGALYAGGGDGASFNFADYGQNHNGCGDPPSPAGTSLSSPTSTGGALRSQSPRRAAGQPVSLDGTIIRIDPDSGAGMPGNPFSASSDANAKRIIAFGMRNPFRFSFRPGSADELWVGDVGWNTWEELDRIPHATDGVAENFGWPCFEGTPRQPGYDSVDLTMCESLYSQGGQTAPAFVYSHTSQVATESCPIDGSSIAGVAFENGASNYPPEYRGALFFADSSRGCLWAMLLGPTGQPDPTRLVPFGHDLGIPVQLLFGPGGDLFYVSLGTGSLHRVRYPGGNRPPVASFTATPSTGPAPLTVQFDASSSFDPDADPLTYAWDLDGDGSFDDSTVPGPTFTYLDQALVDVGLRVTDPSGAAGTMTMRVTVGSPIQPEPVPVIDAPTSALAWRVGQAVAFSGHATDGQDGPLPASRLSWQLTLQHCRIDGCHAHVIQTWNGIASGSFVAPDHEYPSHLELTLTATDSDGHTASRTVRLDPQTVLLSFTTKPVNLSLTFGAETVKAPFSRTVIVGSTNTLSAPSPQTVSLLARYSWVSWSDGRPRTRTIVAPSVATTYQATYRMCLVIGPCP